MVSPLFFPLALGGFEIGRQLEEGRATKKRGLLQEQIQAAIGSPEAVFGGGLFGGPEDLEGLTQSVGGSGLLNDPRFQGQAAQLQFAADLFGAEGGGEIGRGILESVFGNVQQDFNQQQQFGQRDLEQQASFGQQDLQQQNQFEFNAAQSGLDRDARASENQLNRDARQAIEDQKAAALLLPSADDLQGSIPSGFEQYQHPDLGPVLRALPGSQPYVKAQAELSSYESAIMDIDEMLESFKEVGTEFFGAESGRQAFAYGQILSHVAKLRDLGVLQKSDIEFLQDALTDPSGFGGATTRTSTLEAQYNKAQKFFQAKLGNANGKYKLWGLGSGLADTTPEQKRELELQVQQEQSADLLGLTISEQPIPRRRAGDSGPRVGNQGNRLGARGL